MDIKIGVCIRVKNEQKILIDFVNHYLKLGFDTIIIYDNMSDPSVKETLKDFSNVDIFLNEDNKDLKLFDGLKQQRQIYEDCIKKNKHLDWLLLCDTDEFLFVKNGTIKDFLKNFSEDTCTVLLNWITYGTSNNLKYNTKKTIFEQFLYREDYNHFWNSFVKSFTRPKYIEHVKTEHIIYNKKFKVKNVYNKEIVEYKKLENGFDLVDKKLSDDTNVALIHYMTLDFESMLEKQKRNFITINSDAKYSLEWYKMDTYGFKDNNKDLRMLKYI